MNEIDYIKENGRIMSERIDKIEEEIKSIIITMIMLDEAMRKIAEYFEKV